MFLRKHVKFISFVLLFSLLAWYSQCYFEEVSERILVQTWNCTFKRFNAACIYWMILRLPIWILIYLQLLHLEYGFSVYLFLRQGSYHKIFFSVYIRSLCTVVFYFGIGTLIMAIYHGISSPRLIMSNLLCQSGLLRILMEEGIECLSCCLLAYIVHCITRKVEIGLLFVLVGRFLLNFATDGVRQTLLVQMIVNLILVSVFFYIAFRKFTEKYMDR